MNIRSELAALERHLGDGEMRAAVAHIGPLLERILKARVRDRIETARGKERDALLQSVDGLAEPLERATVGNLLKMLQTDPVLTRNNLLTRGWAAKKVRDWGSHDSDVEPSWAAVHAAGELIWDLLKAFDHPEADQRPQLQEKARRRRSKERVSSRAAARRGSASPSTVGSYDPCVIDRLDQRRQLEALTGMPWKALSISMIGEEGQGHAHLSEYCFRSITAIHSGLWNAAEPIRWPSATYGELHRSGLLMETLQTELIRMGMIPPQKDKDGWVEALNESLRRSSRRLFIRHKIGEPADTDPALMRRYLDEVWRPICEAGESEHLILTFEFTLPMAHGWPWDPTRRAAKKARTHVDATIHTLEQQTGDEKLMLAVLPELLSLTRADIKQFLPRQYIENHSSAELEQRAKEIHESSSKGRFEQVLKKMNLT